MKMDTIKIECELEYILGVIADADEDNALKALERVKRSALAILEMMEAM